MPGQMPTTVPPFGETEVYFFIELVHDLNQSVFWRANAHPRAALIAGNRFGDGRHAGQRIRLLRRTRKNDNANSMVNICWTRSYSQSGGLRRPASVQQPACMWTAQERCPQPPASSSVRYHCLSWRSSIRTRGLQPAWRPRCAMPARTGGRRGRTRTSATIMIELEKAHA